MGSDFSSVGVESEEGDLMPFDFVSGGAEMLRESRDGGDDMAG